MSNKYLSVLVLGVLFVAPVTPSWFPWWPSKDTSGQDLNWVLDKILVSLSGDLIAQHGDEYQIQSTTVNYKGDVPFLWTTLSASAVSNDTGLLKNLSSVVRISDATIKQEALSDDVTAISLQAELRLKDLEMVYEQVDASLSYLKYSGGLSVSCPDNAFTVAIDINKGDSCSTKVDSAAVKKLSGCTVELKSAGFFNLIKKWALTYALREGTDIAVSYLNTELPKILAPIVEKHDICGYLNPTKTA